MRKIYSLVLFVFGFLDVLAQVEQPTDIPKVVPPSPNAASLGKYGDIPVSLYTGMPNVNIPLFEVKYGNFSLPVSLSYQSQGMKVEEKAGWVGLNWALNAGGVITRSVRGNADENGYWTYASWTNEYIAANYNRTMSVCTGEFDTQPDMFYFNFAGYSGKFVLDASAQHVAHIIPFQNLKINHGSLLESFEIVDANGIRYLFNDVETTTDDNYPPIIRYYKSAWYLSKIITPAGEITFTYSTDKSYYVQFNESDHAVINPADLSAIWFRPSYQGRYTYMDIDSKILSEINTPVEKVKFVSSLDREDMPTAARLQSITLQDNNAIIKKKFALIQSYFGNTTSSGTADDKRLKLDKVVESSPDDALSKTHTLEYYDPSLVPSIKSLSQDYWGFHNGKSNNSLLIYLNPLVYGTYIANQAAAFHGDRTAVFEKSRVGALKKIIYPTGGASEFVYESNDYGYIVGAPINEQEKIEQTIAAQAKISGTINFPTNTQTFSITENQNVGVTFQGSYTNPPPVENGPTITINRIEANGSRTNIVQRFMINTTETVNYFLTAGNYEVIATVDGNNQTATATIEYWITGNTIITKMAGGVRIKQIVNTDPVTNIQNIKSYEYRSKTDPNRSSGVLTSEPVFVEDKAPYKIRTSTSTNYLGLTQGSHIAYSMVTEKQSGPLNVGKKEYYYTSARDYGNQYGANYRITDINAVVIQSVYSAKYVTDYDVCRGLLVKESSYNSQDQLIKETKIDYNLPGAISLDPAAPNYYEVKSKAGTYYRACVINCAQCYCATSSTNCATCYAYMLDRFYLTDTRIICPWIYKTRTTETTYDPSGLNPFVETVNYFYDNPSHAQLTRVEVSNSKVEAIKIINKYPPDKNQIAGLSTTASAALDAMVAANKIGPIIESERYNASVLINRTRTDYKKWDANGKIMEPEFINLQNGGNPLEKRIQFFSYDDKGNILEQAKANDVHEVYIWGYNKQYPVAKVVGVDYNTAIAYVDQNVLLSPASDQQLRDELSKIRTGLIGKALVTTYTYLPLVGVTSETDPLGNITYYEYDSLNRLKLVRDKNGKVLKQHDYQYQKPITQ